MFHPDLDHNWQGADPITGTEVQTAGEGAYTDVAYWYNPLVTEAATFASGTVQIDGPAMDTSQEFPVNAVVWGRFSAIELSGGQLWAPRKKVTPTVGNESS